MTEPESVFRLKSLDTAKVSKYLLSVFMPVPFGMGKHVFQIDRLTAVPSARMFLGMRDQKLPWWNILGTPEETVIAFPDTFQYLMISTDQYETITMEEAKKVLAEMEQEEKEEVKTDSYVPSSQYL